MKRTKQLALIGVYVALLIGGQFALSFVSGIEVVTVLFFSFAFVFGVKMSLLTGIAFSLLRCFVFGFFPNILILYLIFYSIFALIIGSLGNIFNHKINVKNYIFMLLIALLITSMFTALDNVITPCYYGFDRNLMLTYHAASIATLISQLICTALTVGVLFPPIFKIMKRFRTNFI